MNPEKVEFSQLVMAFGQVAVLPPLLPVLAHIRPVRLSTVTCLPATNS